MDEVKQILFARIQCQLRFSVIRGQAKLFRVHNHPYN